MSDSDNGVPTSAERAISEVLQAERDAENAVQQCEQQAQDILHEAQRKAQHILKRTDERITNMEMRHGHKLDRAVRTVENEGAQALREHAGHDCDDDCMQRVLDAMAAELCGITVATKQEKDAD